LVDKNGTPGAWFPESSGAGVFGKPDANPYTVLEYMEGKIEEGYLTKSLTERIDLIDGYGPNSVNSRMENFNADVNDLIGHYYQD